VHSLEPELRELHSSQRLTEAEATRAIALENGTFFSLHRELLLVLYGAVASLIAGIGLVIRNNLDRIGPVTLVLALGVVAGACYAIAIRTKLRGESRSLPGDYVLLLGALTCSAVLGYAESQFHWLGDDWSWHLLLLAVLHASTAYWLDSRLVLSLALTSFATWLGIEAQWDVLLESGYSLASAGYRSLVGAATFLIALTVHRALRVKRDFVPMYEHFTGNLAFWGALILAFGDSTRLTGVILLGLLTTGAAVTGLRRSRESFIVYAIGYATFGACVLEAQLLRNPLPIALSVLTTIVIAAVLLWRLRAAAKAAQ
jgi:hypothetical protein